MSFNLRQLLGMETGDPHQQFQGNSQGMPIQGQQNPGLIPMQGSHGVPSLQAPDMNQQSMQGNIQVPHPQLRNLLQLSGGSPQGFASDFGAAGFPQPNFQQPQPVQMQGVENPGLVPMQGSRGVRNPQSQAPKRRSPQITF